MISFSKRWTTFVKSRFGGIWCGFNMIEVVFSGIFQVKCQALAACICGAVPWAASDRPLFTSHVWTLLVEACQVVTGLYDVWAPNSFSARFFFHFGNFLIYHLRCDCEKWQVFSNQASTAWQLQLGFVCSILIANDSNSFLQVKNAEVTSSIYLYNICHYFFQWNGNYNSFTSIIVVIVRPCWRPQDPAMPSSIFTTLLKGLFARATLFGFFLHRNLPEKLPRRVRRPICGRLTRNKTLPSWLSHLWRLSLPLSSSSSMRKGSRITSGCSTGCIRTTPLCRWKISKARHLARQLPGWD